MKKFISLFVLANFLFFWTLPASADVVDEYNAGTIYSYQNTNSTDNLFGGINLYGYDKETKTVNKTTYSLLLNDTDYNNDSNYDFIKYFKFDNSTGNYRLVQGDSNDYDLAYYVELNNMYEYDPSFDETTPLIADFIGISYTEANDNNLGGYYDEDNGYSGSIDCDIQGDFVQNIHDNTSNSYGVGVYLKGGEMQNITGNFISNIGTSKNQDSYGAGIYNDGGTIGNVSGNFIGNVNNAFQDARGGGIYSDRGYFGDITASFVANGVVAQEGKAYGGAIYIAGDDRAEIIGKIEGDFIQNYANANANTARGGAIHINSITTNSINGNFIGNTAQGTTGYGGALYSTDSIVTNGIRGDFIQNKASASTESARGGAIYSDKGEIASISGNFIENKAASDENVAYGGAIYNSGIIGNITGNHYYNSAQGTYSEGGSTRNTGTIGNINGDYIGNGAISNKISPLNEDEKSYAYGGGIYNNKGVISDINGDFVQNFATSNTSDARGGGIYQNEGTIGNISGNYIENNLSANNRAYGGAIYNGKGQMGNINGTFINNYVISKGSGGDNKAEGGAIYLDKGKIGSFDSDGNTVGGIINSTFAGNNAISEFGEAKGGAIYTSSDLNIIADNGETIFEDNYTISAGEKKENAIFVGEENATLRLEAKNEGEIRFEDEIEGDLGFNLALKGDDKSKIIINNDIINADISVDNTNVYVSEGQYIAQNPTLSVNSGILNINHLANQTLHYDSFKNTGLINFNSIDVDLKNETMGRITADTYGDMTNGVIDVKGLNLISTTERDNTNILFADSSFSDTVKYTGDSTLYTPIYKYDVSYQINDNDDMGYFVFNRGNINDSNSYNPSVLAPSVSSQAGAYTTQLQTLEYAFKHSDAFMALPSFERMAIINADRYALTPTSDATDIGTFSPLMTKLDVSGFWIKPYSSFESIPLDNGPKVSNISYGTLVGYDSNLKHLKGGWERVLTGYIGYNGASQRYSGIDTYQNGGLLGLTTTFYKNNFFNATTISAGATVGNSSTYYGDEDYTMFVTGIGNKLGYNFEFKDGKFIIQPNLLLSYTFVNTFDYTNAAGLKIKSDPLHALQIAPGIKFIMNTESGWQPYLRADMIWNILDKTKVTADDVRLPEMSIDPYVQYGLGVQKLFKNERLTFFGQALVQNGGRNGVTLNAGIRWAIGKGE